MIAANAPSAPLPGPGPRDRPRRQNGRSPRTRCTAPNGERLPRVAGHVSYWFAWDGYLAGDSTLYPDAAR